MLKTYLKKFSSKETAIEQWLMDRSIENPLLQDVDDAIKETNLSFGDIAKTVYKYETFFDKISNYFPDFVHRWIVRSVLPVTNPSEIMNLLDSLSKKGKKP